MILCLNRKFRNKVPLLVTLVLSSIINISCRDTTSNQANSKSELLKRIDAVQEQVMIQGNVSETEEQAILSLCSILTQNDGLANYDPNQRLILKDVDMAPIFPGCDESTAEKTRICFNNNIASFFEQEFNLSLSRDLNLPEPKQVDAFFIVDTYGKVSGLKVRNAEVNIQAEILRVLRSLPIMKPAVKDGDIASVLCSLRITYGQEIKGEVIYIPERPGEI